MLVGVVALAAWDLVEHRSTPGSGWRRIAPLAWPFAWYAGWALLLRARVGALPTDAAGSRTGIPGEGLLRALQGGNEATTVLVGAALAIILCVAAVSFARHDVLTWITTAYLAFSCSLAPVVWATHAGFTRVLLPLYGFGLIVVTGAIHERRLRGATVPSPLPTGRQAIRTGV